MQAFDSVTYPDKASWIAGREKGIGASSVAAVMGLSPWASPYSLWAKYLGLVEPELGNPKAAEWGDFNPAFFILPDGTRGA